MIIILIISCLLLSGGVYLIRGGSTQILNGPLPSPHILAAALTPIYLAPYLNLVLGLNGYKLVVICLIHGFFWFLTIMSAWEGYFSIGHSTGPRRAGVGWIDWVLDMTFGAIIYSVPRSQAAPGRSQLWWIGRDGLGMFLRMCHALPLFLALGAYISPGWEVIALAPAVAAVFAFVTVLFYAGFNWLPWFKPGGLDYAELLTGIWLAGMVFLFISII